METKSNALEWYERMLSNIDANKLKEIISEVDSMGNEGMPYVDYLSALGIENLSLNLESFNYSNTTNEVEILNYHNDIFNEFQYSVVNDVEMDYDTDDIDSLNLAA